MKIVDRIVEEMHFKNRDEVRVYYSAETLSKLAEAEIKDKTGVNAEIYIDDYDLHSYGQYNLVIKNDDELSERDYELLEEYYFNPMDSAIEFTIQLTSAMFLGCGEGGNADEYIGKYDCTDVVFPIIFTKKSYSLFLKKLMAGVK